MKPHIKKYKGYWWCGEKGAPLHEDCYCDGTPKSAWLRWRIRQITDKHIIQKMHKEWAELR